MSDAIAPATLLRRLTWAPCNKAFVIAPGRINFQAVCRSQLHVAKREKRWRNASRSLRAEKFWDPVLRDAICCRRKVQSADAGWAKRRSSITQMWHA